MPVRRLIATVLLILTASTALAQDRGRTGIPLTAAGIRKALATLPNQTPPPVARKTPIARQVAGGVVGGVGGFFGGAFLGSYIDRSIHDCNCDDPGFKGFLIGMPVGAIVGAIVGVKLASR